MIEIREITSLDALAIADLSLQLGYHASAEETFVRIESIANRMDNCAFAAIKNQKIVGWIHAFYSVRIETEAFVEIAALIIDENNRNQKIGTKLIDRVKEWATTFNVKKLRLGCNELRTDTHKFYKHIGFSLNKKQLVFETAI